MKLHESLQKLSHLHCICKLGGCPSPKPLTLALEGKYFGRGLLSASIWGKDGESMLAAFSISPVLEESWFLIPPKLRS